MTRVRSAVDKEERFDACFEFDERDFKGLDFLDFLDGNYWRRREEMQRGREPDDEDSLMCQHGQEVEEGDYDDMAGFHIGKYIMHATQKKRPISHLFQYVAKNKKVIFVGEEG